MRAGLIGGGFMGAVHTRAARAAGGEVVAVATSSPEGARRAADRLGIATAAPSIEALLAMDLDVVHVCSSNRAHLEHALAVLGAGHPGDLREAPRHEHGGCGPARRTPRGRPDSSPRCRSSTASTRWPARRATACAPGGRVFTIQGVYLQDWLLEPEDDDWRTDPAAGGPSRAFADIGSHLADLTEFVTGERIVRLQALTRTVHPERNGHPVASEDAAALVVETASGAIGTLLVSQVAAGHDNGLVLEVATAG